MAERLFAPIISPNIRVRHPDEFVVGEGSVVDDFCYFSTRVRIGRFSHVANGCSIAGSRARLFELGDYSSVSAGVKIWCTSDDYVRDLVTIIPAGVGPVKENLITGDVRIGHCTAIGANTVIMPANEIPEGTSVGALSFVPTAFAFEPWTVYAGIPLRRIAARDRDAVLRQRDRFEHELRLRRAEAGEARD